MDLVRTEFGKAWIPYSCRVEYFLSQDRKGFDGPVTTVHGVFFSENQEVLLVRHRKRGWEVPGGHVELGESYEDAMGRELYEESQMTCDSLCQLGYLRKEALEERPLDCEYPHPLSYCLFYSGVISKVDVFSGDENIKEARFFSLSEASKNSWIVSYKEYFDKARSIYFEGPF